MTALRLLPPDYLVGAVEALDVIEEFSGRLRDRDGLYDLDHDVYALRSADPAFGSVSGYDPQTMLELVARHHLMHRAEVVQGGGVDGGRGVEQPPHQVLRYQS